MAALEGISLLLLLLRASHERAGAASPQGKELSSLCPRGPSGWGKPRG